MSKLQPFRLEVLDHEGKWVYICDIYPDGWRNFEGFLWKRSSPVEVIEWWDEGRFDDSGTARIV